MMEWEEDMQRLWTAATTQIGWGVWKTFHTAPDPVTVPTPHGQPVVLSVPGLHAVTTLDGRLVALTPTRAVADLLVTVPDLLDPPLRPDGALTQIGTSTPEGAHEAGWKDGYAVGQAEAYEDAKDVINELLTRLNAVAGTDAKTEVAKVRAEWSDSVGEWLDEWPTHEGQGDAEDITDAGGGSDPRPVC
jgi:hypothetical protein